MASRSVVVLLSIVLSGSAVFARKMNEPKEYTEGKMLEVSNERIAAGILTGMQGGIGGDLKFTYVIEAKDGTYEAREFHNGTPMFKPLEINAGSPIMFRVNPKGRLMYVPLHNGEKALEVVKFTPR
jgi:hypothetical protein